MDLTGPLLTHPPSDPRRPNPLVALAMTVLAGLGVQYVTRLGSHLFSSAYSRTKAFYPREGMASVLVTPAPQTARPNSCDTLVFFNPDGSVIFGKNSDRPEDEVQNVVFFPRKKHAKGTAVEMTHGLALPQAEVTFAVLLSQPHWMWGAEMGANECGVVIGNEAIWGRDTGRQVRESKKTILGMDYVRLGLERGRTARQAMEVISSLLEKYGQGGVCEEHDDVRYDNSFLIADRDEAYVLESTCSRWVAQRIARNESKSNKSHACTFRSISNRMSIGSDYDLSSADLLSHAKEQGYWDGKATFHFGKAYGYEDAAIPQHRLHRSSREGYGYHVLNDRARELSTCPTTPNKATAQFGVEEMMAVLRDHSSGVCMHGGCASTASWVSYLPPLGSQAPIHWVTGTCYPCQSAFKPFLFPVTRPAEAAAASFTQRVRASPARPHDDQALWSKHQQATARISNADSEPLPSLRALEHKYLSRGLQLAGAKGSQTLPASSASSADAGEAAKASTDTAAFLDMAHGLLESAVKEELALYDSLLTRSGRADKSKGGR